MIARRSFIAGSLALLSQPVWAQERKADRVVRVGVLDPLPSSINAGNIEQLRKGLRGAGYNEGRNLAIEYRASDGRAGRYSRLAEELEHAGVDVLIARGTQAALGARNVTRDIPIVALGVNDPVDTGLVASLERPGGNVTGIAFLIKDLETRRVDVLRALAPKTRRVAGLMNMGNPAIAHSWKILEEAARGFKLEAVLVDVRKRSQIEAAFETARQREGDAVIVQLGTLGAPQREAVVELAAKHRLPAIYTVRQYVDAGGLVSYGLDAGQLFFRAAAFVDKLVKGAKPAELAMEAPPNFELVINRKTLRSLDLVIPPDLLLRSNEIV
ncbi:MAG TPA: ABC transporter substrate-binding protein [Burkholderiales bacterium]|jgi:putative ABC transport system substrate-binding protein|nr:ABC transporter substrate-binding protein [Burkholderiales bacterium]